MGKKQENNGRRYSNSQSGFMAIDVPVYYDHEKALKKHRPMLRLHNPAKLEVQRHIKTGKRHYGFCKICYAPECMWWCSWLPFCKPPRAVVKKLEDSKYIWIRENSIEWNKPTVQFKKSHNCCPIDCFHLDVVDDITVMYFDNPTFDNIANKTRRMNEKRTKCFGGRGERVVIEDTFCYDNCVAGKNCVPCLPACCPESCLQFFGNTHEMYVDNADEAVDIIKAVKRNACQRMGISVDNT